MSIVIPHLKLITVIRINQAWSMDFMGDSLKDGRSVRTFNLIDDCNRECLTIGMDFSLPTQRVFAHWKESLSGAENPVHVVVTMDQNILVRILLSGRTRSKLDCVSSRLASQLKILTLNDLTALQGKSGWS